MTRKMVKGGSKIVENQNRVTGMKKGVGIVEAGKVKWRKVYRYGESEGKGNLKRRKLPLRVVECCAGIFGVSSDANKIFRRVRHRLPLPNPSPFVEKLPPLVAVEDLEVYLGNFPAGPLLRGLWIYTWRFSIDQPHSQAWPQDGGGKWDRFFGAAHRNAAALSARVITLCPFFLGQTFFSHRQV